MSGGNEDLLIVLADKALRSTPDASSYWSLQRRHPDGVRWIDVASFLTRADASWAEARAIQLAPSSSFRVRHVRRSS